MALSTKLEDKLEGLKKFLDLKYRIGLILKEKYIKNEFAELEEAEAKEKHEQDLIKEMRIIVDCIKDHLIPQVSSKNTSKKIYALSWIYEGRNIKLNINLRAQLKGTKMSKGESIQD